MEPRVRGTDLKIDRKITEKKKKKKQTEKSKEEKCREKSFCEFWE